MSKVIEVYLKPMREKRDIVDDESFKSIFSNLEEIGNLSVHIVKRGLLLMHTWQSGFAALLRDWQNNNNSDTGSIGQLLIDNMPSFRLFAPFCGNLAKATSVLNQKRSEKKPFADLLDKCAKGQDVHDLSWEMLKPMQRVTKYPLLVRAILKATSPGNERLFFFLSRSSCIYRLPFFHPDHPDFPSLTTAVEVISVVVAEINAECDNFQKRLQMEARQLQLQADLADDFGKEFLDPSARTLLFEMPLRSPSTPNIKLYVTVFLLFFCFQYDFFFFFGAAGLPLYRLLRCGSRVP